MLKRLEHNLQLAKNMLADEAIWLDANYFRIEILNGLIERYKVAIKEKKEKGFDDAD